MYRLVFSNNLDLNDTNDDIYSIEIISKLDNSKLSFGTVSSVSLSLKLNNRDKRFSAYTFKNKFIECYINNVKKYKFYIDEVTMKNGYINITAYDKIADLDRTFKGISFPCTLNALIVEALGQAHITLDTFMFTNQGFMIHDADLTGLTCREVLMYCMELCGGIGILNEDEKFVIRWFSTNEAKEIDINNFISYESNEEDVEFNNIRLSKGSNTYNSNPITNDVKGTIYITSDNPLLANSTSVKIKSLINNLKGKYLSYFPCKVQVSTSEKYALGDCLSFKDEDGNKKIMLVSNITIKNLSNVTVESLGIDTTVSESSETETGTEKTGSHSNNFNIKNIINVEDVQFSDCNENTKIFVSCTMTFQTANGNIQFTFNRDTIRTYNPVVGTNTFTFIINGAEEAENILSFVSSNNYTYLEYSFIYCNCLVVDYSEEDSELDVGEEEATAPYRGDKFGGLYFYAGIENWIWKKTINTTTGIVQEKLFWGTANQAQNANADDNYVYALYSTRLFNNYVKLKNREFYVKLEINGTITVKNSDVTYKIQNAIPDGSQFIYSRKRNGVTNYYKSSTGIIKMKCDDEIRIFLSEPLATVRNWNLDNLVFTYTLLDDDMTGYSMPSIANREQYNYTFQGETEKIYSFKASTKEDGTFETMQAAKQKYTNVDGLQNSQGVLMATEHFFDEGYTLEYNQNATD